MTFRITGFHPLSRNVSWAFGHFFGRKGFKIKGLEPGNGADQRFRPDKHRTVDGPPSGGGAGLVMRADVIDAALSAHDDADKDKRPLIYFTPRGRADLPIPGAGIGERPWFTVAVRAV